MTVQHRHNDKGGHFFIEEEDRRVALLVYHRKGEGEIIIEHTEVDPSLRGQNIGYQLVETAVNYARSSGLKILPVCPFASAVFARKPEFGDVLAAV